MLSLFALATSIEATTCFWMLRDASSSANSAFLRNWPASWAAIFSKASSRRRKHTR